MHPRRPRSAKKIAPRKRPTQDRAHATVDAILQAATYILARQGWRGLNTNAIAKRAGVNIASLYQYFPNKEAIVAELRRRYLDSLRGCANPTAEPPSFVDGLKQGVATLIRQRLVNPELHRVFEEELPRSIGVGGPAPTLDGRLPVGALEHVPDVELAGFVARVAAVAVVDAAARERPELLASELFHREVATLLERYLVRAG